MSFALVALIVMTILAVTMTTGCGVRNGETDPAKLDSKRKTSLDHFGTTCVVVVYDDFPSATAVSRFESAWNEIKEMLAGLENAVSSEVPGSDVERFNRASGGAIVTIGPVTGEIIGLAMKLYKETGGAFNPAVANLVDLWGFSPRFRKRDTGTRIYDRSRNSEGGFPIPDRRYVEVFRKLSDFSKVRLDGDAEHGYTLTKDVPDVEVDGVAYSLKIDLGGIAKGCAADKAAAILKKHGYTYGYVNLGMSSMQLLKRPVSEKGARGKNMWAVNVADPDDGTNAYLKAFAKDAGISTSGTRDSGYSTGGRSYSHIIDPETGEPTKSEVVSATVMGPDAGRADAITTALCVMSGEKAVKFMGDRLSDLRVAMIIRTAAGLKLVTNMPRSGYALIRK